MECKLNYGEDLERQLREVLQDLPARIGIMLIGPDGRVKTTCIDLLREILQLDPVENPTSIIDNPMRTEGFVSNLQEVRWPHLVDLQYHTSAVHDVRHMVVKALMDAGAEKVIGVYIIDHEILNSSTSGRRGGERAILARSTAKSLNAAPPNADGLHMLITVI